MTDIFKRRGMAFLASVTSAAEASIALASGADIIDCKDPSKGALGALDVATIRSIVAAADASGVPVSATVGDLKTDPAAMVDAARRIAATSVDFVKIGFFGDADPRAAIFALGRANLGKSRLVAVLMADRQPDFSIIADLAEAKFAAVMLDTADKTSGSLLDVLDSQALARFVTLARSSRLASGLAGSLRLADIERLAPLDPSIIGFRGALCAGGRTGAVEPLRVAAVRTALDTATSQRRATERSVA